MLNPLARKATAAISDVVSTYYAVTDAEMRSGSRLSTVVRARHMCWALMRNRLGLSLTSIAWEYGHHHTTVLYALKKPVRDAEWRLLNSLLDERGEPCPGLAEAAE